jgi:hypothetical protein
LERIENFTGYFKFMDNDFPSKVLYQGIIYPTASHAFFAAKADEAHVKRRI